MTNSKRVVALIQQAGGRFLDAHEIPGQDFRVVTRPRQENNTQLWHFDILSTGGFTLRQASSGRFLDAYLSKTKDFQVVTRPEKSGNPGNNTQHWVFEGKE